MKIVAASAVSLLAGLGLGYLAFHNEPMVERVETNSVKTTSVDAPVRTEVEKTPSPGVAAAVIAPAIAPREQQAPATAAIAAQLPADQEVVALRARVNELESALKTELELRKGTEGERVPVPAGLPARLRDEKLLVSSFNAAMKEAGFTHGEVTNVDCSEHPCIVFGTGFGARGDLEKLLPTNGFAPYAKDGMSTFGFQRGADPSTRFFGVAVLPQGAESSDELGKRIGFRVRQMEEVSRPNKK
jgi:hypothetical protein